MKPQFESKDGKLFIDGREVLHGWESYSGWYWFALEKVQDQVSVFPDGSEVQDTIWFGLVQGFEEEFGDFSEAELNRLKGEVWKIPRKNLPFSGRRN